MTHRAHAALLLTALFLSMACGPAHAEGAVAPLHAAWQGCLHRSFDLQAMLTSRTLAADTALRDCRERESAYLTALSSSPLVDGDDVARVRPALLARARGWLLGRGTSPSL
ncbi:hypothetical protein G3T14_12655 [Methylobacterium sp. BTF04]|uniref:hypothetical protein n=1 Tax=Methylobacterium sp. BTF04 TaxID=2708300 RepID=UPI0013D4A38D|nr:hypothetical protein [Methylobacterium sp. BTF04]NEU12983.1 hypothetical protein [Methylobacterium sp. BTF04]